ncbi:MAG: hypothetical protein HFG81_03535 [Dorea sp.]|uniref:hypothetical protein n=1 Tax=Sporofaciens musculi TaxID=2681861 RepID=UPI0021712534|nr:hypothetical protein [Sporofaciens musculi]MCI9421771.1 hypothetical protein [Dorea sp.]
MKMKKLVAMLTAGVLCLGMSVTAFAAGSVTDDDIVAGTDANGNKVVEIPSWDEMSDAQKAQYKEAAAHFATPEEAATTLKNLGYELPKDSEVVVLGVDEYTGLNGGQIAPGTEINFNLSRLENVANGKQQLRAGDQVTLVHATWVNGKLTWEVKRATVKWDAAAGIFYATVTMDSLSPIAFVEVMQNGDVIAFNSKGEVVSSTTSTGSKTTVKTSPKTGE